ncbi:hypothetical protein BASA83_009070 [Batrachochytrium salamandrivorans]|nr:hypothetical protein BASA83_009070 [Batrachochytrium salamandrivorans]
MPDDDLSLSSQDDTNMSDIDDSLSEISDHMDSDVDMTSSSIVLQTNHNPAVGGKGLPISLATQYSEGIYDYEDADDDLDIPEVEAIVEDDKDVIGAQYDEDLLDDDIDDDDAILSDAENEPEDPADSFSLSQPRAIKVKAKANPVEKYSRSHKRKIKQVAYDPVHISVGEKSAGIDKLLSYRVTIEGVEELLVKYKGMGYYHTEWLMRSELELERGSKNRIRKFLEKPSWDHYSEDEPFNPSFSKIDRIIDVGEHGNKIMYLVKWCAQAYEYSTWESQDLIEQIDIDKISEYNDRNSLKPIKRLSYNLIGRHHPAGRWVKLENSPIYKNDNMLRSYQLEGLDWLMFWKNCTVDCILYQLFLQENLRGPFLIVTPLSTIGNWEREIRGWTDMNVVVYHGNQPSRNLIVETEYYYRDETGAIIPDMLKFDVILTTYEMAMSGAAQLRPIPWRCVVLDEAHRLKNRSSKVTEILKTYTMEHRVLLTGTPLQNSLDELWALLNFLEPHKFASEMDFKINYGSLTTAADVEKLQNVLKPLMLRRLKEDVEKTIPVKEETIVEVELTTTQKKWYRSILEKNFSWLKQGTLKKTNVPNLINTMIELRKCCIHPWLLKGAEDQILDELHARSHEQQFNALIQSSGKMVLIDKLLKKLKQGDHKVLIFSQMTKCLDLIQDYLRGRAWIFERIDGGVRGDLRQAVFLLCTRAGGVGINLTAADTCIIFDSDWNPQNDLQAQSRCHRIGQKKPVQIYRLITRNTYEREMFDRASMKLGLDKALLQRMDMQGESGFSGFDAGSSKSNALSTEEVEELLKKGAYGAFMDDEASKQFCEEDIDQILERRTQVIRHDSKEEKSSIFSKASFQATGSAADVDVNDPDFWDKVAKQAELQIVEDIPEEFLIMDMPRNRRQVNRFGVKKNDDVPVEVVHSPSVHDDPPSVQTSPLAPVKVKDELKLWSLTERTRLERMLMQHGFNSWQRVRDSFARRSIYDLQACCRVLLNHCLNTCTTVEPDVIKDVKRAMQCFLPLTTEPEFEPTSDELECRTFLLHENGEEIEPEEPVELPEEQQPYPWANERQISEFNSFWKEANKEYIEHIERKAKNMLIRVALMFNIRNKCDPRPDMHIPKFLGAPPAPWWGDREDKDLMIGICIHGYQQKYSKLWEDPNLCFYETFQRAALGGIIVEANATDRDGAAADEDADDNAAVDGVSAVTTLKDEVEIEESSRSVQSTTNNGIEGDVDMDPSASSVLPESNSLADSALPPASDDPPAVAEPDKFVIPSATDLGVRVRRILNSMSKHRQYLIRELARKESVKERTRQRDSERAEKMKLRDKDFSKKQKHDFQRILTSFGLPREVGNPAKIDWTSFKELSELDKSRMRAMEFYYDKIMKMSRDVIEASNSIRKVVSDVSLQASASVTTPDVLLNGADTPLETDSVDPEGDAMDTTEGGDVTNAVDSVDASVSTPQNSGKVIFGADGEILTLEKAKKIVKRVELFEKLRSGVLEDPMLEKKLQAVKRHGKSSMPKWWEYSMDKPLLVGINSYGLLRPEPLYQDANLPFLEISKEFERSLEERTAQNIPAEELVWGKFEDKFWPREALIVKRFELLVNYASRPLSKKAARKHMRATEARLAAEVAAARPSTSEDDFEPAAAPTSKVLRLKLKLGTMNDDVAPDGTSLNKGSTAPGGTLPDLSSDRRSITPSAALPSSIIDASSSSISRSDSSSKHKSSKNSKSEGKTSSSKPSKSKSDDKSSKSDAKRESLRLLVRAMLVKKMTRMIYGDDLAGYSLSSKDAAMIKSKKHARSKERMSYSTAWPTSTHDSDATSTADPLTMNAKESHLDQHGRPRSVTPRSSRHPTTHPSPQQHAALPPDTPHVGGAHSTSLLHPPSYVGMSSASSRSDSHGDSSHSRSPAPALQQVQPASRTVMEAPAAMTHEPHVNPSHYATGPLQGTPQPANAGPFAQWQESKSHPSVAGASLLSQTTDAELCPDKPHLSHHHGARTDVKNDVTMVAGRTDLGMQDGNMPHLPTAVVSGMVAGQNRQTVNGSGGHNREYPSLSFADGCQE